MEAALSFCIVGLCISSGFMLLFLTKMAIFVALRNLENDGKTQASVLIYINVSWTSNDDVVGRRLSV